MLFIVVGSNAQERREHDRLRELYLRHADRATRLAFLLTGDRGVAEDLVQDAFEATVWTGAFQYVTPRCDAPASGSTLGVAPFEPEGGGI